LVFLTLSFHTVSAGCCQWLFDGVSNRYSLESGCSTDVNFNNLKVCKRLLADMKQPMYLVPAKDLHLVGNILDVRSLRVNQLLFGRHAFDCVLVTLGLPDRVVEVRTVLLVADGG